MDQMELDDRKGEKNTPTPTEMQTFGSTTSNARDKALDKLGGPGPS
jgi:hypothetical protein